MTTAPVLPDVPPLAGFTVGVTAARRADELGAMLERRGATVQHAPALRIVPLADDTHLLAATQELVARPPELGDELGLSSGTAVLLRRQSP